MIKKNYIIAILLVTSLGLMILPVSGATRYKIEEKTFLPTDRDWDDLSLAINDQWHNYSEVLEDVQSITAAVPELTEMEVIGHSYHGQEIVSIAVTNEQADYQKAETLVVAHHHGREQISVESALRFLLYLLNNYGEDAFITNALDTQVIYIIPSLNPDALDVVVEEENYWLRKTTRPWDDDGDKSFDEDPREDVDGDGRVSGFDVYEKSGSDLKYQYTYYEGIDNDGDGKINEDMIGYADINRNYETYWREGDTWSEDAQSDIYPGPEPFSENETQAFRDFALEHRFAMAYSLHSGINATFFPGYTSGNWFEPNLYWTMVEEYRQVLPRSYTDIYFTSQIDKQASAVAGGWGEWMYQERGTLVPITFELYRNISSVDKNSETIIVDNSTHQVREWPYIYEYFSPDERYIDALWDEVRPGFDYLLEQTPLLSLVDYEARSDGEGSGATIELSLNLRNLSPLIHSIDDIKLVSGTEEYVLGSKILATSQSSFELDFVIDESMEFMVGNEFSGYLVLSISIDTSAAIPVIFNPIMLMPVVMAIYWRKKRF